MPASTGKSCLAVLRSVAQISQRELAELVDCAPVTIQSIELHKLRLSERLAKRIEVATGIDANWLLGGDYGATPTSAREPRKPYTRRHYEMTRAEVSDPRTDLGDLAVAEGVISSAARQLAGSLLTAYRKNQTVFFYYKLRESLEDLEAEFPPAHDLAGTQDRDLMRHLHRCLTEAAESKKTRLRR